VLLKIQGVNDKKSASYYFGKRVAYIYKTTNKDAKYKVMRLSSVFGEKSPKLMVAMVL